MAAERILGIDVSRQYGVTAVMARLEDGVLTIERWYRGSEAQQLAMEHHLPLDRDGEYLGRVEGA